MVREMQPLSDVPGISMLVHTSKLFLGKVGKMVVTLVPTVGISRGSLFLPIRRRMKKEKKKKKGMILSEDVAEKLGKSA